MSRRDELAKGIQQTTEPMADQKQVYPTKPPDIPSRKQLAMVKSTASLKVLPLGLEVQAQVNEAEWREMGDQLFSADTSLAWYFGDWINSGNFEWGAYKTFAKEQERNWLTITDYAYIARNVHLSCRHDKLSLSHHKAVAPLYDESDKERTRELQRALLQYAAENNLNREDFRAVVHQVTEGAAEKASPALPDNVIDSTAIPIVIKPPFYEKPIDRMHREFVKRWRDAKPEDRQAALKRLKALVRELENME